MSGSLYMSTREARMRTQVKEFTRGVYWMRRWILYYGVPLGIAIYAFVRDEAAGVMAVLGIILGVTLWQFALGFRQNRILEGLLTRYEQALAEKTGSDERPIGQ
jgi:hypothetical protein